LWVPFLNERDLTGATGSLLWLSPQVFVFLRSDMVEPGCSARANTMAVTHAALSDVRLIAVIADHHRIAERRMGLDWARNASRKPTANAPWVS